jgi:hypothetical protein
MHIENAIPGILGKTITGVVVKRDQLTRSPASQVFLVFSDNTYFEIYASTGDITSTSSLSRGGMPEVRRYMSENAEITLDACLDEHGNVIKETF